MINKIIFTKTSLKSVVNSKMIFIDNFQSIKLQMKTNKFQFSSGKKDLINDNKNGNSKNTENFDKKFKKHAQNVKSNKFSIFWAFNEIKANPLTLQEVKINIKKDYKRNKPLFVIKIIVLIFVLIKVFQFNRLIYNSSFYIDNAETEDINVYDINNSHYDEYLMRLSKKNEDVKKLIDEQYKKLEQNHYKLNSKDSKNI